MKHVVKSIERISAVDPHFLPNGCFEGVWSGYEVEFRIDRMPAGDYRMRMSNGLRGTAKCIVTISDGDIGVEIDRR